MSLPWYSEGLHFKCTECGNCCTGSPGYTWMTHDEMDEIAKFLDISIQEFRKKYTRTKNGRYSLLELPNQNYDCIFLKENKCSIYPVRPKQCRTFPWWRQNLKSKKDWKETAKHCEGISDEAPIVSLDVIQESLDETC